jgi:Bacterial Ig domain
MPHRTLTHELLLRPGLLALAVVAVLGGIVVDPAAATSQDMGARQALLPPSPAAGSPQLAVLPTQAVQADPAGDHPLVIPEPVVERLELEPAEAWILPGASQDYTAEGFADGNRPVGDVIARTEVTITGPGPSQCSRDQLGKVSCTASEVGDYTVKGTLRQEGKDDVTDEAVLHVDPVVTKLRVQPDEARILQGNSQPYTAEGTTAAGPVDVTAQTGFTITGPGPSQCSRDQLGKVSCTASEVGDYTVSAILSQKGRDDLRATATLRVTDPVVSLKLKPETAEIPVRTPQDYIAEGTTAAGRTVDVTDQVALSIDPGGRCPEARCTPAEVGDHRVTATLDQPGRDQLRATATLHVVPRPTTSATTTTSTTTTSGTTTTTTPASPPVISSVQPGFTFAGMSVEVGGNTGSCNRAGMLTFHGNNGDVSVKVTADRQGNFVARVTIPRGTFPGAYQLELTVDCKGQLQRAQGDLSVVNIVPEAADDSARTIQDTPVSIPVTDNDRNPDPDTGYPTRVLVSSTPSHGTAEEQTDQTIIYTPEQGFIGQDRFQYNLCDDILNAAGTADCSTATVTVTVIDAQACQPSPGNISSIKVNPSKSPGGRTLGITATVDRKLAGCPFRLFLGGTPLPPDVPAGPDGGITAERGVPKDAKPGLSPIRLATMSAQTVAQTPFEVVPPGLSRTLKLLIGAGALLAGALARIAFRRLRTSQEQRRQRRLSQLDDLRVEPHTRPVEVSVEPEHDNTRTFTVRLEPHPDPGNQTVQEMNP